MPAADHDDIVRSDRVTHSAVIYGRAAPMSSVSRETSASIGRGQWNLLADAEVAEDHVEQIFDIDRAGDMAEAAQRHAQIFGAELGQGCANRSLQRKSSFLQSLAMPGTRQNGGFDTIALCHPLTERRKQSIDALARQRGDRQC